MPTEAELFASVDALLYQGPVLPAPDERKRLRKAAGVLQEDIAAALHVGRETVVGWETGKTTPRPPRLQAYQRLLDGWAGRFPADQTHPAAPAVPETFTAAPAAPARAVEVPPDPAPVSPPAASSAPATAPAMAARNTAGTRATTSSRRPPAPKATRPATDPKFPGGPLGVLDGDGTVYCVGGLVLECPATTRGGLFKTLLKTQRRIPHPIRRSSRSADVSVTSQPSGSDGRAVPEHHASRPGTG